MGKLSNRKILESLEDSRKVLDCLELYCPTDHSAMMETFCVCLVQMWLSGP